MGTLSIIPAIVDSISARAPNVNGGDVATGAGWNGRTLLIPYAGDNDDATLLECIIGQTILDTPWLNAFAPDGLHNNFIEFGFDQNTPIFSLDGAPAISFNSLPSGFLIDSLLVSFQSQMQLSGANISGSNFRALWDGDDFDNSPDLNTPITPTTYTYDVIDGGNPISALEFIAMVFRIQHSGTFSGMGGIPPDVASSYIVANLLTIEGTFTIITAQWTLEVPDEPVSAGDPILVTSDPLDPDPLDFEQILTVEIHYIDSMGNPQTINVPDTEWVLVEENQFIFLMPIFPSGMAWFSIVVTSTQFSGSVTLGQLTTLFFTSATGIYRLVTNKRSDTLYLENDPPNTIDVKIPDPFWKSGYVGG